jgi:hypothetical protein
MATPIALAKNLVDAFMENSFRVDYALFPASHSIFSHYSYAIYHCSVNSISNHPA